MIRTLIPRDAMSRIVGQVDVWRSAAADHTGSQRFTMAIAIAQDGRGRAILGHFVTENEDARGLLYSLARAVSVELADGPLSPDDVIAIYPVSANNLVEQRELAELARSAMEVTVDKPPGMAFTIAQVLAVAHALMVETVEAVGIQPLSGDAEAGRA